MKKKVTIRLYKRFDSDLITLYLQPDYPLAKYFKKVLINYVHYLSGEEEKGSVPLPENIKIDHLSDKISFQIIFYGDKNPEVIAWIDSIQAGFRNSLFKSIFRSYLPEIAFNPCLYVPSKGAVKKETHKQLKEKTQKKAVKKETGYPVKEEKKAEIYSKEDTHFEDISQTPENEVQTSDDGDEDIFAIGSAMMKSMF